MTRSRHILPLVAALAFAGTSAVAGQSPVPEPDAYPATVASCGVDYTYTQAPQRVLLGAPGAISTLDALGVSESAIGYLLSVFVTDGIEAYPNLTLTSPDWTPSREFLIAAQPDLFLSNDEQQLTGDGTASKEDLAAIPANLYVLGEYCVGVPAPDTIDVVYRDIERLGLIYGIPDRAAEVIAGLQARVAAARALNPGEPLRAAAVSIWDGKVYALSGSYYAAVLDAIGVENVFADLGASFTEVSAEDVLASDADVIFATHAGGTLVEDQAIADATAAFANAPAVRDGRVFGWSDTAFQSAGVDIVDVIEQSAQALFGD
ncbi:MAG: ABC transporter substrate-binding protein [Chloroflexi bacterium]|nr:ABC transporter substrate-binding protein [Chloroflexota bacterium]